VDNLEKGLTSDMGPQASCPASQTNLRSKSMQTTSEKASKYQHPDDPPGRQDS
jgi:hypothetical protein